MTAIEPVVTDHTGRCLLIGVVVSTLGIEGDKHVATPISVQRARRTTANEAGIVADARLHDLSHTFASRALALGETLPMIGKLLGHNDIEMTARYAHLTRDSIHEEEELIAGSIATDTL